LLEQTPVNLTRWSVSARVLNRKDYRCSGEASAWISQEDLQQKRYNNLAQALGEWKVIRHSAKGHRKKPGF